MSYFLARLCLQISIALKEWDIPYEELEIDKRIGTGRFGTVYRYVTMGMAMP